METAADTRMRLSDALQNRDLMKSVGEYEGVCVHEHVHVDKIFFEIMIACLLTD